MRIFFACRRYCPGEAWTNRILAYAKGLSELGENVTLAYLISDKKRSEYIVPVENVEVLDLWKTDCWLSRKSRILSYFVNLIRFRGYLKDGDYVFVYGGPSLLLWNVLTLRNKVKVFCEITEHPYYSKKEGDKKCLSLFKRISLQKTDGLFVISNNLRNYFIRYGIKEDKIHVINMFVDIERFSNLKKTSNEKYIAYCGIVSLKKDGVDILLKAFSIVHAKYPDYKLFIIGRFFSSMDEKVIRKLITEMAIDEAVVLTGQISPAEMPCYLCNAELLALARPNNIQSQNGFPTKLGEYLATGNPVVVTKVGEIGQFLKDQYNSVMANPDDINDFAEKLIWTIENRELSREIGRKGRKLAEEEFSYKTQSLKSLIIMKDE